MNQYVPLVTPFSQPVGTQATLNILLGERYKVIPHEVKNYINGFCGRRLHRFGGEEVDHRR